MEEILTTKADKEEIKEIQESVILQKETVDEHDVHLEDILELKPKVE